MAHSLAEAWVTEMNGRGVNQATPGSDAAQNLFYAGAAAMLAMVAEAGANGVPSTSGYMTILNLLQQVKAELQEYLEVIDA